MTTTTDLSSLAGEALDWFEKGTRDDGSDFWTLRDGRPEWLYDLVHEAHGDFMPDDWRYEFTRDAFAHLADGGDPGDPHEFADTTTDVYTSSLLAWVSSNINRPNYCDEARDDGLIAEDDDLVKRLAVGQYTERVEVFSTVALGLETRADDLDDDA